MARKKNQQFHFQCDAKNGDPQKERESARERWREYNKVYFELISFCISPANE